MEWSVVIERAPELALGLARTLGLCSVAALAALLIGAGLAWIRLRAAAPLRWAADAYTALCLGIPLLVVIYLLFFALPQYGLVLSPESVGVAALAIYYGPYFAQVMRAAVQAVPAGQWEAAAALGLPPWHSARRVVLPQALPLALPPLTGLLIGLLKDSALLAVVSVPEFMFAAKQAISDTYAPLEIYGAVALVYWVLSAACAAATARLEHRLTAYTRPATVAPP